MNSNAASKQTLQPGGVPVMPVTLNHSSNQLKIEPPSMHEMPQIQQTPTGARGSARAEGHHDSVSPNSAAIIAKKKRNQNEFGNTGQIGKS